MSRRLKPLRTHLSLARAGITKATADLDNLLDSAGSVGERGRLQQARAQLLCAVGYLDEVISSAGTSSSEGKP